MPISLRLSPKGEQVLDDIVRKGHYKDRSEAIRAALGLLRNTLEEESQEKIVVSISKADLERLRRAKVVQ